MIENPYISFVIVGRNDNYGKDFLHRANIFFKNVITLCEKYKLSSEFVIVEFNPPENRPKLKDAITWPDIMKKFCKIRFIEVINEVHRNIPNSDKMPLFEYIGKNVGVRRARAEYIIVTNPDVLFSEGLVKFLAEKKLSPGYYYRIARYDVRVPVPNEFSIEEQLSYCRNNIIKKHGYWYSPTWTFTARFNPYRRLRALAGYVKLQIWNRSLVNPYVNASGDFFLMHKEQWYELRGYPELKTHSFIDSYFTYMVHIHGYRLKILRGNDIYLFHQDHDRNEQNKRPLTNIEEYHRNCKKMIKQRGPIIFNDETWGLFTEKLPDYEL